MRWKGEAVASDYQLSVREYKNMMQIQNRSGYMMDRICLQSDPSRGGCSALLEQ
jgi:hypothetical protein